VLGRGGFRKFGEEMREIGVRLKTIRFCTFHEGVKARTGLGAGDGIAEEPSLAADHERPNGIFGTVGIERDFRIEVGSFFVALVTRVSMPLSRFSDLSSHTHSGSDCRAIHVADDDCNRPASFAKPCALAPSR